MTDASPFARLRASATRLFGSGGPFAPAVAAARRRLRVDTRALAAMRILLGTILLVDLAHRAPGIEKYYTDSGVYPIAVHEATYTQFAGLSIHALSGSLWFQSLLFVLAGLFALAFVVGYRTRLAGVCSFVLLVSLHARNPAVLNGGDILLRTLLPLALLTPLGERWSIDAVRRGSYRETVMNAATTAVLAQPLVVFTQNAVLKHQGETWYAGEALQIAFANDEMTVLLGNYLGSYPTLLELLNYGWVTLLAGSIGFLFLTAGRLRAAAALVYIGAFLGMVPTLMVGLFPFVLTASVLPYLTPPFWNAVVRVLPDAVTTPPPAGRLGWWFGGEPIERRLAETAAWRGRGDLVAFGRAYAGSLLTILGVFALVFVLLYGVGHVAEYEPPYEAEATAILDQSWGLYAPNPTDSYSWFITNATLDNGSTVAAVRDSPSFDRPPDAATTYDSFRERKFMSAVSGDTDGAIGRGYAEWACREATGRYGQPTESITLYRMIQPSPVDGTYDDPTRQTLIEHDCGNT